MQALAVMDESEDKFMPGVGYKVPEEGYITACQFQACFVFIGIMLTFLPCIA